MKTLTRKITRTGALVALVCSAFFAAPASADTLTYMASFPSPFNDPGTAAVSLPQFNTAMYGTNLTSVTIELVNVYVTGTAAVMNTTGSFNDYSISLSGQYKVSDSLGDRISVFLTTPTYSTVGNPMYPSGLANGATFSTPSETNSTAGSGMTVITGANIALYEGTGNTSTFVTLTSANGVTVTGPAPYNTTETSSGVGTYEIIYNYTPVPEPSETAAWMLLFVACIAGGRKLLRRSSEPASPELAA